MYDGMDLAAVFLKEATAAWDHGEPAAPPPSSLGGLPGRERCPHPGCFTWELTGGLGVEPIKALEHEYGELALQLLILTLAISPLRRLALG